MTLYVPPCSCPTSTDGVTYHTSACAFAPENQPAITVGTGTMGGSSRRPHVCPVCRGAGQVDQMLYSQYQATGTNTEWVACRSCNGTGIIWEPTT